MSKAKICLPNKFKKANFKKNLENYRTKMRNNKNTKYEIEDYPTPSEARISTMTVVCNINTDITLDLLARYIPVYSDDSEQVKSWEGCITYVEYANSLPRGKPVKKKKGRDPTKNKFFNQTTVIFRYAGIRKINVKIFNNGKLQMTGVKTEIEGKKISQRIIDILKNVKCKPYQKSTELPTENNIKGDFQATYNPQTNKSDLYRWDCFDNDNDNANDNANDNNDNNQISNQYSWKSYQELVEHYGDTNWLNADMEVLNKLVPNNEINNESNFDILAHQNDTSSLTKLVLTEPNTTNITDYRIALINSDFYTNFLIKNDVLHNLLYHKYKIYSSYEPCDYPGVKSKYCWNINNQLKDGHCYCETKCASKKKNRICKMITISVFQSGSVIITGANHIDQIKDAYKFINKVLKDNYNKLKRTCINSEEQKSTLMEAQKRLSSILKKKKIYYIKKSNIINNPFIDDTKNVKKSKIIPSPNLKQNPSTKSIESY